MDRNTFGLPQGYAGQPPAPASGDSDVAIPQAGLAPWSLVQTMSGRPAFSGRGSIQPMSWEQRYFNVFFAYRGAGDLILSSGKQLEDNLTRALATTLRHASPVTARSFAVDVCDVDPGSGELRDVVLQPHPGRYEPQTQNRLLLGLSPTGRLSRGSLQCDEFDQGGSRPDAAFAWRETAVFVESKVVADLDGRQMARHARNFGLGKPWMMQGVPQPPDSWKLRSWQVIAEWARSAADSEPDLVPAFLLRQVADYLDLAGVTSRRPRTGGISRRVDPPDDWPAWMLDLAVAAPLEETAALCSRLYGDPESDWFVCGDGVKTPVHVRNDSKRVADLYRHDRRRVPPRLMQNGGDVITARRYLSIAYGPDNFVKSFAEDDLGTRVGYVRGVGTDRAVLLGLFAWAWATSGARATRVLQIIERVWPDTPIKSLVALELHEKLGRQALASLHLAGTEA